MSCASARGSGRIFADRSWYLRWLVPAAGVAVVIYRGPGFADANHQATAFGFRLEIVALADGQDNDLMADLDDLMVPTTRSRRECSALGRGQKN